MCKKLKYILAVIMTFGWTKIVYGASEGLGKAQDNLKTTGEKMGFSTGSVDINTIVGNLIQSVLALLGVIFLVLVVYGGILWMTAGGNDKQIEKARDTLFQGVIGLVIVLSAYAVTTYIISTLLDSLNVIN